MPLSSRLKDSSDNRLLAVLPDDVRARVHSALEPVALALGDVVYDAGGHMAHIYFPTTAWSR